MTKEQKPNKSPRFVWRGLDLTRYGDFGDAVCLIQTPEEAAEFWDAYVEFLSQASRHRRTTAKLGNKTPQEVAGSIIGYLMGYYGPEDRERVYRLFPQATHPIFGHDFGRGAPDPTPEAAFEAGKRAALGEFS